MNELISFFPQYSFQGGIPESSSFQVIDCEYVVDHRNLITDLRTRRTSIVCKKALNMRHLMESTEMPIWIDILWIAFVIIISPLCFLLTMAINELPVIFCRRLFRMIRSKSTSI